MTLRNIKPEYSKKCVNKAGENVRLDNYTDEEIQIIENWRAAHNKILNDWQSTLRVRCKGLDIIFAQRLKRRLTIFDKLNRQPEMHLARMHDIAGCRLIFKNIEQLLEYRNKLHSSWKVFFLIGNAFFTYLVIFIHIMRQQLCYIEWFKGIFL